MYGKGSPGPTASGMSTGATSRSKRRSRSARSSAGRSSRLVTTMPSRTSWGRTESRQQAAWRWMSSSTRWRMRAITSSRGSWSGVLDGRPASMASSTLATRTMKNSSRLLEKMARNFARSSSGCDSSSASSSTRELKSSHESSRLT